MSAVGRRGDEAKVGADSHGCPLCPHTARGPASEGSPNVFVNGRSVLRVGDRGKHSSCCGPNTWEAAKGAPAVFINDLPAHRQGDAVEHCGGRGRLIQGSADVFVGDQS